MKPTTIIEQALKHPDFRGALRKSSYNNKTLATHRLKEFAKVFSNQSSYDSLTRTFSVVPAATSTTQTFPGYGTVLQLASLLANVSSFSGFLSIEKALDQPNMVLHFLDIIGTNVRASQQSPVFPAVGPTRYDSQSLTPDFKEDVLGSSSIDATFGSGNSTPYVSYDTNTRTGLGLNALLPVLPYTVRVRFTFEERYVDTTNNTDTLVGTPYEVVAFDAGNGTLLFPEPWGYFSSGISYGQTTPPGPISANLNFTFNFNVSNLRNNGANTRRLVKVRIEFVYNYIDPAYYPPLNQDNRFSMRLTRTVAINTRPMQLTLELNRQELVAASKSLGVDVQPLVVEQLASIYQKLINRYIVGKYIYRFWDGSATSTTRVDINVITPLGITTSTPQPPSQYDQYTPILDKIRGGFEEIRMRLAEKSFIASKITALLVSPRLAGWLARSNMVEQSLWVEETVNYINDLYGYYMGIPVLRHTDLSLLETQLEQALGGSSGPLQPNLKVGVGFAVAVLPENNMAPTARGIYLPVTQTATVANFNNPVQEALSLFFQEETEALAPELVVPFAFINLPVG